MSQSGSLPAEQYEPFELQPSETSTPQWKQEVNQRLAAHRNRRGGSQDASASREAESPRTASARAAEAAARVAARYAKAPSYSQLLAGEARAVVRAAGAAAEAARNAQAAAQAVLFGLESGSMAADLWEPASQEPVANARATVSPAAPPRWQDEPPVADQVTAQVTPQVTPRIAPYAGAQPRWQEALPVTTPAPQAGRDVWSEMRVHPSTDPEEGDLFPEESFDPYDSYDPMGKAMVEPVQHLPANLIEFPRELVATRKARPRLAEGPFYDESHHNSQLSIFEVDPDLLPPPASLRDASAAAVAPPGWASIELDHHPHPMYDAAQESHHAGPGPAYVQEAYVAAPEISANYGVASEMHGSAVEEMPVESIPVKVTDREGNISQSSVSVHAVENVPAAELMVAQLSDRLLAGVVDGALVTLAFLAGAVVVIASTTHPPAGRAAMIAGVCGWLLFGMLYQFLFLSYAEEGTPGMRYARIALCTFDDDNPTPEQMRLRIPAMLLSAVPAGLGLFWALFDGNHLGWHDRLTKTYQRKY